MHADVVRILCTDSKDYKDLSQLQTLQPYSAAICKLGKIV